MSVGGSFLPVAGREASVVKIYVFTGNCLKTVQNKAFSYFSVLGPRIRYFGAELGMLRKFLCILSSPGVSSSSLELKRTI